MRLSTFDDWARAHHGVITLAASGLSRPAWYRAIEAGAIEQLHPFVARLHGTPDIAEQRMIAATFAVGHGGLASHRSAARLWGVTRSDDDPVDVTTPPSTRRDLHLDGVTIHRTTDGAHLSPQRRYGIPCTNILRTLVDLGAVDPDGVVDAVGHVLATRLADLPALAATILEHSQRGRSGIGPLRRAVDEWSIDAKPADSVLEASMRRLVERYRLPDVEFHPVIDGFEVDFRVVGTPLILECDGWTYHGLDRMNFERDRTRDADLTAAGWIVVRFTYRSIVSTPGRTAHRILANIARWGGADSPDGDSPIRPDAPDAA
jgi:very-short-patch-repair endonuclease